MSVYQHRFLSADHIHRLHFHPSSLRVAQMRLRAMWAAGALDRTYLPPEQVEIRDRYYGQPLYSLAAVGAKLIADGLSKWPHEIPHTKEQNRIGYVRMRHNLVFTDLAIAMQAFAKRMPPWTVQVLRESALHHLLPRVGERSGTILPDGVVTISHPLLPIPQTILVEVVRASVKGGNDTIRRRLHRYRAALKAGFFRNVYGLEWVRHVVFLTPSGTRAENLRLLARDIQGGERLFRFGAYEHRESNRVAPKSLLTVERLTEPVLLTPSGELVALLPQHSNSPNQSHV